LSIYFEIVGRD